MIFYGWNHQIEKSMGEYQGDACGQCGQATCKLMRIRTFFTLFFIPLICYRTIYYKQCLTCGAKTQLSKQEAHAIMDTYLPWSKSKMRINNIIRYAVLAIVAAVIALMIFLPEDEEAVGAAEGSLDIRGIKALVSEDGSYNIFNPEGQFVADVEVEDGKKRVNYYIEYMPCIDETITSGHTFQELHYYYERDANELSYIEDQAMIIVDENFVGVRFFWYEPYDEALYWGYGVEDLNSIDYGIDRVTYPLVQYLNEDETEYYTKVYIEEGKYDAALTFYHGTNEINQHLLTKLDISKHDRIMHTEERLQYLQPMEIGQDFTIHEILEYIEDNHIEPDSRDFATYFEGVEKVVQHSEFEAVDPSTQSVIKEVINFDVQRHDSGYYVCKLIED